MRGLELMSVTSLFIDIGQKALRAMYGQELFSFPIERGENGRLTELCRQRMASSLGEFLGKNGWRAGTRAFCAIGGRGVSLRRLSLPAVAGEELRRVLRLQIESEFPLPPEELAWGGQAIGPPGPASNGGPARQQWLVVALKKELVEDYAAVFSPCGLVPSFTLGALARAQLYWPPPPSCSALDIGATQSELMRCEKRVPVSIRALPWGGESITGSIQEKMGLSREEAEKLKFKLDQAGEGFGGELLQSARQSALAALAQCLRGQSLGEKLYLTGKPARDPRLAPLLSALLGGSVSCQSLEPPQGTVPSAAIAGLKKSAALNGEVGPLILQLGADAARVKPARPAIWKWAAAAGLLSLGALLLPYGEAALFRPLLERKLAALQADRGRLATIDQELDFLKFLQQNQPPYLETLYLLAKSAPQGARIDGLTMGRRQQISMQLKMANAQEVSDLRAKLIDSGWFANVMVEEQNPTPDNRVSARMTAELQPLESRKPLRAEPPGQKKGQPGPSPGEGASNAPPSGAMAPPAGPPSLPHEEPPPASLPPGQHAPVPAPDAKPADAPRAPMPAPEAQPPGT